MGAPHIADETKAKILAYADRHGAPKAAKKYRCSAASIHRWRHLGYKAARPGNGKQAAPESSEDALLAVLGLVADGTMDADTALPIVRALK